MFPTGSNGNVPSLFAQTLLSNPYGIAYSGGNIYVTNAATDSITVYPASASGRTNPVITMSGLSTQLDDPVAIALDSAGNIYVANLGSPAGNPDSITVYSAGSNGNVSPTAVITGPNTGLEFPSAIAVDSQGNIYVANRGSLVGDPDSITVYSSGSTGNSSPANVISGSSTQLASPEGVAIDSSGNIYATSNGLEGLGSVSVLIFPTGSTGNVAPTTSIDGDCAGLNRPGAIALDSSGDVYVTDPSGLASGDGAVVVFAVANLVPGAPQCLEPISNISGQGTGLDLPLGVAIDPSDNIYVTNSDANSVTVFQAGSTGNATPLATIASPTGVLVNPTSVALDSDGQIYVANAGPNVRSGASITIYASGSYANMAPIAAIGPHGTTDNTGLIDPQAISVGPDGSIYVADRANGFNYDGSILVFSAGSDGDVSPVATISGDSTGDYTGLNGPLGLALDSESNLYVLNRSGGPDNAGSITVYPPGANGNVFPIATIADGPNDNQTQLESPAGLALDSAANIYVTNDGSIGGGSDSITIYAAGNFGDVAPMATISGPDTGLNLPHGIAIDSSGNIYVANDGSESGDVDTITVYSPGSSGDATPFATITGSLTGLEIPCGLAVGP